MRSMFTLRLFYTLYPLSVILNHGINAEPLNKQISPFDSACSEPPDSGLGQQLIHIWYFNTETSQCRQLLFKGFGGSNNKFVTRKECEFRCLRYFIDGAQRFGPKIRASVEHIIDQPKSNRKFFAHRSDRHDYHLKRQEIRIANRYPHESEYKMGANINRPQIHKHADTSPHVYYPSPQRPPYRQPSQTNNKGFRNQKQSVREYKQEEDDNEVD